MWPRGEVRRNLPLMRYAFGIPAMEGQKKENKHTNTQNKKQPNEILPMTRVWRGH